MKLTTALRNTRAGDIIAAAGTNPKLKFYTGAESLAPAGTLLATLNVTGALAVTVQDPEGVEAPATVQNTAVGSYYFDLDLTKPGTYAYRAVATGAAKAASQGGVFVSPPIF